MAGWNPWHGCHKYSEGCTHCYVYRMDDRYGRETSEVHKTADFTLPLRRTRNGDYKIPFGQLIYTCFSSDFLLQDADAWRPEAWGMMDARRDCEFLFITKRIVRLADCLPPDWGAGWPHITICCTVENQRAADERLPVFLEAPIATRCIICEPLLGPMDIERYLGPWIDRVVVGGESGPDARVCDYDWVLSLREQCDRRGVGFHFKQTGANFIKDGKSYRVPRKEQHRQALRAGINTAGINRWEEERRR